MPAFSYNNTMSRIPVKNDLILPKSFEWLDTSSEDFSVALKWLLKTSKDLFVYGPAGVGKSVLVNVAYNCLRGSVMVLSSTGISASNLAESKVPATTIHCGLRIPAYNVFSPSTPIQPETLDLLMLVDNIIIDEIGMVSNSLFDHIGRIIKTAEKLKNKKIRLIVFGDVLQLPPVIRRGDEQVSKYFLDVYDNNVFFFNSKFFKDREFINVGLNTIHRQKVGSFQNILNRLRLNIPTPEDFAAINKQTIPLEEYREKNKMFMILAPKVATVRRLNDLYGKPKKSTKQVSYTSSVTGTYDWSNSGLVEDVISIWEGQQVMCIYNDTEQGFQNGTLGIAVEVKPDEVIVEKANGDRVVVGRHTWVQYDYDYDRDTKEVEAKTRGSVCQIGCKPATASTIHKSQGLTLDNVYLYLEDDWVPESGIYLALSRCRTLEGIGISRRITARDIRVLSEARSFVRLTGGI